MKVLYWTIGFVIITTRIVIAITIPPGHELLKQEGNYYTILNNATRQIDTYCIEGEPAINGWQTQVLDDSLSFTIVADLHMFLTEDLRAYDFLGDGYRELVGCDLIDQNRVKFLENDGHFNFRLVNSIDTPGIVYDLGDVDRDGRIDILTKWDIYMSVYEQPAPGTYADSIAFQIAPLSGNFRVWPRYSDLDDDGNYEISFMNSDGRGYKIEAHENTGDNQFDNVYEIRWPWYGPGMFASGDYDGDGRTEIVGGTDDGRMYVFESVSSDSFVQVWQNNFGHPNTYMNRTIGDCDGDGYIEWVTGSHDFARGGFFFGIYEATGDNQYQQVFFDSLAGNPFDLGGISAGDIDDDGVNEFVFSANANVGIYKYYHGVGWRRVWLISGLMGDQIPYLVDTDGDGRAELILSTDRVPNYTRVYRCISSGIDNNVKDDNSRFNIYPNPSNSMIKITFDAALSASLAIDIFDILGRAIYSRKGYSGIKQINWDLRTDDGKEVISGIYFVRIKEGQNVSVKRFSIVK
jgi:hypothetical protein